MDEGLRTRFAAHFGGVPDGTGTGFGRVNIIGDHTDYNDGFVMPCILNHRTEVAIRVRPDRLLNGFSGAFGQAEMQMDAVPKGHWLAYAAGALAVTADIGVPQAGIDLLVESTVPEGAGVSSSAAFGVALVRALCAAFSIPAPPAQTVARLAQKIENSFIGLQCGIMDHMVSATGEARSAMHLDCRDLSYRLHSLPAGHVFLVIHSGSGRKLSEGIYNERVAECRAAAAAMGVASLRDADTAQIADIDDRLVRRRAQHVLSENDRVNAAAQALVSGDVGTLGTLITASHKSLATDYEVSAAPLDILVKATLSAGALGSRLTGAGFGGCIVCLAPADLADDIVAAAQQAVPGSWLLDSIAS